MNQSSVQSQQQTISVEQRAEKLVSGLDGITKAIFALKAENQSLQHIYDQSIIHYLQLREDTETMKTMYRRLKAQFERMPQQPPPQNQSSLSAAESQGNSSQIPISAASAGSGSHESLSLVKLQWDVNPPSYKPNINLLYSLHTDSYVCSVCFNYDGDCLAFANRQTVFIVSSLDGKVINTFDIPNAQNIQEYNTRAIRISPDSQYLALGGPMNNVLIYSIPNHLIIGNLEGHENKVSSLLFSNDSTRLYSGGFDGLLCIWDLKNMKLINKISHENPESSKNSNHMIVALTKDDEETSIAVGFMNGNVGIYDPEFSQKMSVFKAHDEYLLDVTTSPYDNSIATSSHDKTTKIWSLRCVASLRKTLVGHDDLVLSTCFSPKEPICFTGSKDETIKAWDYKKGECLFTIKAHKNTLFELAHHPTKKVFVSCSGDGLVCLWSYNI